MNNNNFTKQLLLSMVLLIPSFAYAQTDGDGDPPPEPPVFEVTLPDSLGVNVLNLDDLNLPPIEIPDPTEAITGVGNKVDSMSTAITDKITDTNSVLADILQILQAEDNDIKRRELATALINYEALARIKEFQLNMDLLYELAPGAMMAIVSAENIAKVDQDAMVGLLVKSVMLRNAHNFSGGAIDLKLIFKQEVRKSLLDFVSGNINADQLELNITNSIAKATQSSFSIYNDAKKFFISGDLEAIKSLDPGSIFTTYRNLDPSTSIGLIGLLTDPLPVLDSDMAQKLKQMRDIYLLFGKYVDKLNSEQKEKLATRILEMSITSMSNYALADLVARRTGNQSILHNLKTHSRERFLDQNWHTEVAKASEAALLRELVQMMAFQQWVNYQSYRLQEQQVALTAATNATIARLTTTMDMVRRELDSAMKQAQQTVEEMTDQIEADFDSQFNVEDFSNFSEIP